MNKLRTVTLEFLRHGPPHNQLLSPLTQYLALCGNHSATTVTMPFEHNQLLVRLNALLYGDSQRTRKLQLLDTAQIMADVLAKVPGLIAELAERSEEEMSCVHLRLVLSASELALLPFELANAPNGFPGAGQALTLQAQAPICLTREVRRVSNNHFRWPRRPRILFIAASPQSTIPLEAHLLALRRVIDPWTEDYGRDRSEIEASLKPHLVVLPQASVGAIRAKMAEGDFTHVHILAHGVRLPGDEEKRFGLALHSDRDPKVADVVDGARLATLLRCYRCGGANAVASPAVVTLASCDSGQQGSVVGAGASVAHALHEGGIPLVVASQFPITFEASVLMAEILYEGLLWGIDPRTLLNDLRWQLKARIPETHDWASLVAYAALPDNLHQQLFDVRIKQAHRSIDSALKFVDKVTDVMLKKCDEHGLPDVSHETQKARNKKTLAMERLAALLNESTTLKPAHRVLIHGLLASAEKRDAKVLFAMSQASDPPSDDSEATRSALRRARDHYQKAFDTDYTQAWALVQRLSLDFILDGAEALQSDQWELGRLLSERERDSDDRQQRAWALGNLIELYLLASGCPNFGPQPNTCEEQAMKQARDLARIANGTFELHSTRRQIERYVDWYSRHDSVGSLKTLAEKVLALWPLDEKFL